MKFRFCGDLDCPDWLLAEMNTLSRMTSIKIKMLCQLVARSLLGEELDFEKVTKLTADAKYEEGETKAVVAAVAFVLESGARHGAAAEGVGSELQQLGLPREHALALCRVYADHLDAFARRLRDTSMRLNRLEDMQWRLNFVSKSSFSTTNEESLVPELCVEMAVADCSTKSTESHQFVMSKQQLELLLSDLKKTREIMDKLA